MAEVSPSTSGVHIAHRLQLQLAGDFGAKLSSYNGATPLVQFTLDTSMINRTFNTVFELIGALQGVVSDVCATVNRHDSAIDTLRSDIDDLKNKFENDPRFGQLESKIAEGASRLDVVEKKLSNLAAKMETIDHRLGAQESKKVDFGPLEKDIALLRKEVNAVSEHASTLAVESKAHATQLKHCEGQFANIKANSRAIDALFRVFEMNPAEVLALTDVDTPAGKDSAAPLKDADARAALSKLFNAGSSPAVSKLTLHCLGLPSFAAQRDELRGYFDGSLAEVRRKHADDIATLNGRLADKADLRDFNALANQVADSQRKLATVSGRVDKVVKDVASKIDIDAAEARFEHLQLTKADKADLVDLLRRGDLGGLEEDVERLQAAIDAISSKTNLELSELRSRPTTAAAVRSGEQSRRSSIGATDPSVLSRLDSLEKQTKTLDEVKADKKALGDLYQYVDSAIANIPQQTAATADRRPSRPSTPVAHPIGPAVPPPDPSQRHGALQPLTRPPSAGREPPRASIPETVRPPSPNLQYTSSPMKYVPNNAKYRATATLFDSDGTRTNASVTAARAVSAVEHLHNVARVAAGQEHIPADHTVHDIPAN